MEFGEWLCAEVLKYVPHRQWVFSIPKRLRIYFMFDRHLLAGLSRCAWKVLSLYLTEATSLEDAKAGAAIAVQSFGDYASKDGNTSKTYDALDGLAQLATHIPNKGEQADFAIVAYGYDG